MGSSSSKGARRLPQAAAQAVPSRPAFRPPPPQEPAPGSTPSQSTSQRTSPDYRQYKDATSPSATPNPSRKNVYASGSKDEAIKQDAADPHFMANLSRLGQVAVPKPGTPFENRAPALRTLLSRDPTSAPYKESVPQLTASQLTALLDRIKTVDSADVPAVKKLYSDYGVTAAQMSALRKWINSPSIDKEKTKVIISEQGEESVEMTAVWVDAPSGTANRAPA